MLVVAHPGVLAVDAAYLHVRRLKILSVDDAAVGAADREGLRSVFAAVDRYHGAVVSVAHDAPVNGKRKLDSAFADAGVRRNGEPFRRTVYGGGKFKGTGGLVSYGDLLFRSGTGEDGLGRRNIEFLGRRQRAGLNLEVVEPAIVHDAEAVGQIAAAFRTGALVVHALVAENLVAEPDLLDGPGSGRDDQTAILICARGEIADLESLDAGSVAVSDLTVAVGVKLQLDYLDVVVLAALAESMQFDKKRTSGVFRNRSPERKLQFRVART